MSNSPASGDETQIRQLINEWKDALCARDLDRLMQHYSPDVVFFDAVPPHVHRGAAAYRRTWEKHVCPSSRPISGSSQVRDLVHITISGDLGGDFLLPPARLINTDTHEAATCGWVRVSVIYQRRDGQWLVIHEHVSVPFDPATSQAAFIREP